MHRYVARPRLPLRALLAWELGHGLTLPAEYREWLTWMGNGGVGPDNGLYPLEDWNLVYGQREEGSPEQPFPFDEAGELDSGQLRHGTVSLSTQGCYEHFLVVSGPCAGEVWVDDRSSDGGLYPETSGTLRLGFYDWIDSWITRSLRELIK